MTSNNDFSWAFGPGAFAGTGADGATPSGNDVALVFDPLATGTHFTDASATGGMFDFASIFGDNSTAIAGTFTGSGGNFDLAEMFGNGLTTTAATGGSFLYDILGGPPL